MPRAGPRKVQRYSLEFKLEAVKPSHMKGVEVQAADSGRKHPGVTGKNIRQCLSAPVLKPSQHIGYVVSIGGILGIACILAGGWHSDRTGDRLRDACACTIVIACGLLLIGVAATPAMAIVGYLLFAATFFTGGVLVVSSWADLLHARELAVGSAAINTLW